MLGLENSRAGCACRKRASCYFDSGAALSGLFTATSAMPLTPLQASHKFPSRSAIMLRTTPPPDGITQVWNFSVAGSKRTTVLGLTPDSLYHTMLFTAVIP